MLQNRRGEMKLTKNKKGMIVFLIIAISISFIISGCDMVKKTPEAQNNTVVAKIGDQTIKKIDFDNVFEVFKVQYEQKYGSNVWENDYEGRKFIDVAKEKILEGIIEDTLQLKKAGELGIVVSDEEINVELENFKTYFDSDEKFNEFLTAQKMTEDYLKDNIRKDMIVNKLREKLTEDITVTDEDIDTYYASHQNEFFSVKASHILVATEEEAKAVKQRLNSGESFNELAKELSIDPSAAQNAGDLGYFKHGDMVEPFEKAAFDLQVGQISDIVATQFGYHIIKVEDKKLESLDEIREELRNNLLSEKKLNEYNKILQDIVSKVDIKRYPENL